MEELGPLVNYNPDRPSYKNYFPDIVVTVGNRVCELIKTPFCEGEERTSQSYIKKGPVLCRVPPGEGVAPVVLRPTLSQETSEIVYLTYNAPSSLSFSPSDMLGSAVDVVAGDVLFIYWKRFRGAPPSSAF